MHETMTMSELIREFSATVSMVFDNMVGMPANTAEILEGVPRNIPGNILACITISAPQRNWVVTLHCDTKLAFLIYSAMFGPSGADAPVEDVYDAIGELANVIVGNFKNALTGPDRRPLTMSVPTVESRRFPPAARTEEGWFAIKFDVHELALFGSMTLKLAA